MCERAKRAVRGRHHLSSRRTRRGFLDPYLAIFSGNTLAADTKGGSSLGMGVTLGVTHKTLIEEIHLVQQVAMSIRESPGSQFVLLVTSSCALTGCSSKPRVRPRAIP